ncbi:hypothetical protein G3580_07870 [Nitrogeniibacter mangrovi]|uniref:Uncharacterized protein n=1 Tax=Nitrogeniibacter mangrovi TaxID=2016596 RepID=A0A6C1B3K4_9RHOO|nr:hypothetical protein [Nitrogeniibacter mangrovi]QID17569.1 hypothetical protein G3580_07870 [Nitrogeniibacter mangrovi]
MKVVRYLKGTSVVQSRPDARVRSGRLPWLGLALIAAAPLVSAAGFTVPDCGRLEQWARQPDTREMIAITPRVKVNALLRAELIEPLFGQPVEQWQHDDFTAARKQMSACIGAANKRRDTQVAGHLAHGSRLIGKAGGAVTRLARFRQAAGKEVDKILAHPATPEMPKVIDAAIATLKGEGSNKRLDVDPSLAYVAGNVRNLQRDMDYLTEADRQALIDKLEAHRADAAAAAGAIEDELAQARAELDAAPATAAGMHTLQQLSQAPVLSKVPRAQADAFRGAVQRKQNAIRVAMNRQRAEQTARAEAEARRPMDLGPRLAQLIDGDAVDAVGLAGLAPGMSRQAAVATLKHAWKYDFEGGLPMMNSFVATRQIFPQLKQERRNGGKVELGVMDGGKVGQIRLVEFYKAMLVNTNPQAWLSKRLGEPDEVRAAQGGRLLTWKDGDRRLQVLATNQIENVWRFAGYESEMAISVWTEDFEDYLADVAERCDATRSKPRNEVSMSDTAWFAVNCGLAGGSKEHPGI